MQQEKQPKRLKKEMKKIVHLIDSLGIGGAQTYLLTMLRCADRKNFNHVVYSLKKSLRIGNEIESLGIKVISLDLIGSFKKKRWIAIIRKTVQMLRDERPDILETHLTWSRIIGTIAFLIVGKKKIISVEHGDIYNTGLKFRIANFLISFFIDMIIACSNAVKIWLNKNYGIPLGKIVVMHGSVLTDFFKPKGDKEALRGNLGIGQNDIAICSMGTLGKGIDKGMNYCIDAVSILTKRYKNIKLFIVGDGELRGSLEKQANDLGLEDVVKFLGLRRDIDKILNAIDIFMLASIFEPFGIVLLEAMSTEKPVVGSASGGISEIINDGSNGFLTKPCDSEELSRALEKLIVNKELRIKMGKQARQDVEEKFNAVDYMKRLETIYEKC